MNRAILAWLVALVALASMAQVMSIGERVSDKFIYRACSSENSCGDTVTKVSTYNPFKQRPVQVTQDPQVLAMAAVRQIFKAAFNRDPTDEYVLKESKLFIQKGYPQDKYAESMLRAAYKKSPNVYLKYAKPSATARQGYSGYSKITISKK